MNRLDFVCGTLLAACLACVLAQSVLIDGSYDNVLSSVIAGVGICGLAAYFWISRSFDDVPFSSLALFGFCVTAQFAALISQTAQGGAFVQFLRDPVRTFSMLTAVQYLAILVHYCYRKFLPFQAFRQWVGNTFLSPLGVYDVPKPAALWLLGIPGFISLAKGAANIGDVSGKVLEAMTFMVWMPFLILVYRRQFGDAYSKSKMDLPAVVLYAMAVFGVAMAHNTRGMMFMGPASLGLLYLVVAVRVPGPMPRKSIVRIGSGLLMLAVVVMLLADLVTAMAVARGGRDDVRSRKEMLEDTYYTLIDRAKIEAYRNDMLLETTTKLFDEVYLSNPILNRLSETKFHDNMIFFSQNLAAGDRERIIDEELNKMVVMLPQPVLDFFDLKIKKYMYTYSMGDVYVNAVTGGGVGGAITGSIWADAVVFFGEFWPFVVAGVFLLVFLALDGLGRLDSGYFLSPAGMCMVWTIFIYGLGGESFAIKALMLLRDWPQKIFLYLLVFFPIRYFWPQLVYNVRAHQPVGGEGRGAQAGQSAGGSL
jgi:hypothetical protein